MKRLEFIHKIVMVPSLIEKHWACGCSWLSGSVWTTDIINEIQQLTKEMRAGTKVALFIGNGLMA
jgi:hypothetical protein